ncbi:MAG TPA: hypothetical protein VFY10_06175 [Dehalococcoidia bacterium]|nr:hypothetical protein [Dehalococcoidia bacterium]
MKQRDRAEIVVEDILIDERKAAYIRKKGVQTHDVLEVLEHIPHFFEETIDSNHRYSMLGPNRAGKFLLVAIARVEGNEWRLITAYWLTRRGRARRLYEEE